MRALTPFCRPDEHAESSTGIYRVNSLYFDADNLVSYFQKIEGEGERRKLRVRYYGHELPNKFSFEIKKKTSNNVSKSKVVLCNKSYQELLDLVPFDTLKERWNMRESERPVVNEIQYLIRVHGFNPKVTISYSRLALFSELDSRLRITFDSNIKGYRHNTIGYPGRDHGKYLVNPNLTVLEVKFNSLLPRWIVHILQEYNCSIDKVSKYCKGVDRVYEYCLV